jgi:hypothetical protein
MVSLGYSEAEHEKGWELALPVLGYNPKAPSPGAGTPSAQSEAISEIDQWDEPNFARAGAALNHLHPDQHEYIFGDGLQPAQGVGAIASVETFVNRVVALRDGTDPDREATRDADKEAVATLERRNIFNAEIEAHLKALLATAKAVTLPVDTSRESDPAFQAAAKKFDAWLNDWRETARTSVKRRDYLIRLGLAKRRSRKGTKETEEAELPVVEVSPVMPEPEEPA